MGRKFELCFIMAKESIPFTNHPALLQLEEHHGVDVGSVYRTPDSAKSFTSFIAISQHHGLKLHLLLCAVSRVPVPASNKFTLEYRCRLRKIELTRYRYQYPIIAHWSTVNTERCMSSG